MRNQRLNDLTDTEFDLLLGRMVRDGDRMFDPVSGRVWPVISGGADEGDDGDDGESEDEESDDEADAKKADAKLRRTAGKAAIRKLVRDLGFGNVGDLKDALAGAVEDDEVEEDEEKPVQKRKEAKAPVAAVSPEALNGRIAVELASAGLLPEKVKRAVAIVSGDVEAGEAPSDEDLSDLIEELRDSEPGWFRGSDGDEEKPKGGVHGARRPPKTRTPDPAVRGKEIFDARSARKEFKLPV